MRYGLSAALRAASVLVTITTGDPVATIQVIDRDVRKSVIAQYCSATQAEEVFYALQGRAQSLPRIRIEEKYLVYRMANFRVQVEQREFLDKNPQLPKTIAPRNSFGRSGIRDRTSFCSVVAHLVEVRTAAIVSLERGTNLLGIGRAKQRAGVRRADWRSSRTPPVRSTKSGSLPVMSPGVN